MAVEVATQHVNSAALVDQLPPIETAVAEAASSYLQYLPAPFHEDAFVGQFLRVFESILAPLEHMVDMLPNYFDPCLAPAALLPWLSTWVGLELDENWPPERARALIAAMPCLYRWRGTRRGLRTHLELYAGHEPAILESFDGVRIGQDGTLGTTAQLGEMRPHWVSVTVYADTVDALDERIVRQIIEFQKPAHVGYQLQIRPIDERL